MFSALTWLLVGSSTEEFSSLDRAWASVTRISLGEGENFYPQILAAQPTVGPVVVVIYQVLGIVLLLNVVIAILLEVGLIASVGTSKIDTDLRGLRGRRSGASGGRLSAVVRSWGAAVALALLVVSASISLVPWLVPTAFW